MLDAPEVNEKLLIELVVEGGFESRDIANKTASCFIVDLETMLEEYPNLAITFSNSTISKADQEQDAED